MIDPSHLLKHVIQPVLTDLDLWSGPAERLVLGTACQESACGQYLVQLGGGPALGIYQCEPATHDDIWQNFLLYHQQLQPKVTELAAGKRDRHNQLIVNLEYATAMCRIHYLRVTAAIPGDLPGQAAYWKKYYNTELGKGTTQEYMNAWNRFVPQGVV